MNTCKKCKLELVDECFDVKPNGKIKKLCQICCELLSKQSKKYHKKHPPRIYDGTSYESRQVGLNLIGFANYREYLNSDLWRSIRYKVYNKKGSKCYLCGGQASQLHHNRYHRNDLLGLKIRFINPVCNDCHEGIEFKLGSKVTCKEAANSFKKIRRKYKKRSN